MTRPNWLENVVLVAVPSFVLWTAMACASERMELGESSAQTEVTQRDLRGRVKVLETRAGGGVCIAEVTYEEATRIHVVVVSRALLKNLGYLQINDGTESGLSNKVLMENFNKAIRHCLPFIIPGYVET